MKYKILNIWQQLISFTELIILLFSRQIIIAHAHHRGIVTRVVGGYPTSVSLQKKAFGHICGGTYLHGINVLSAAHCFIAHGEMDFRVENPLLFIAIAGASDVKSLYVPSMQIRLVVHIEVHPRYNNTSKFNDIALVRLDRSFTLANEVIPVALGPASIVNDLLLGSSNATADPAIFCQVLGWGYLQEASPLGHGENLMMAEIPLLHHDNCSKWYNNNQRFHFSKDLQICAGFQESSVDACQGDSGGPLICDGMQIGIVSTGEGCGRRERPGLYTRLDIHLDWIGKIAPLKSKSISSSIDVLVRPHLLLIIYMLYLE